MQRQFLQRFFPASRATHIRKEICGIRQCNGESLYEYWEQFKELVASYPYHQIAEPLLIQYFYEGLSGMDRSMVDAASGGARIDKTLDEARRLISTMAENHRQFGVRSNESAPKVNEVSTPSMAEQIANLTVLVQQLAAGQKQTVKPCGICSNPRHPTDACPSLQQETTPEVNAVGEFPGQPRRNHDPYSNFYNLRWRDHPNFSYRNPDELPRHQPPSFNRSAPATMQPSSQASNTGMSLEDIVKSLAVSTQQFQ